MNDLFTEIDNTKWYKTIYRWMIDSKYRKYMRLDDHLKRQLIPPQNMLANFALNEGLIQGSWDSRIISILKWVRESYTYIKDDGEYWQTAQETIERGQGDCLKWDTKLLDSSNQFRNIAIGMGK